MFESTKHDPTWVVQMNGSIGKFNGEKYNTISDAKLLLFTGLKDKNGKEIYEGDIIPFESYFKKQHRTKMYLSIVIYKEQDGMFDLEFHNKNTAGGIRNSLKQLEVIGNIYENPELLK